MTQMISKGQLSLLAFLFAPMPTAFYLGLALHGLVSLVIALFALRRPAGKDAIGIFAGLMISSIPAGRLYGAMAADYFGWDLKLTQWACMALLMGFWLTLLIRSILLRRQMMRTKKPGCNQPGCEINHSKGGITAEPTASG